MAGETPAFPALPGTAQFPFQLRRGIAERAWKKANSDENEFRRLCFAHVRGEIDLIADDPPETDVSERVRMARLEREFAEAAARPPSGDTVAAASPEPIAPAPSPAASRAAARVEAAIDRDADRG